MDEKGVNLFAGPTFGVWRWSAIANSDLACWLHNGNIDSGVALADSSLKSPQLYVVQLWWIHFKMYNSLEMSSATKALIIVRLVKC